MSRNLDDELTFDTIDEAIAEAMRDLEPGAAVTVHADDCEHDGEDEDSCTCTPLTLVVGAAA